MLRSPQGQTPRRAPARTAPRRNVPAARPARTGRGPRRSGPNLVPLFLFALLVIALAASGSFVWRSRQPKTAAEAPGLAALTPASPTETAQPSLTPTPTLPVVSSGFVPGAEGTSEPVNPAEATTGESTPAPAASRLVTPTTSAATPAPAATAAPTMARATAAPTRTSPIATATTASLGAANDAGGPDLAGLAQRMLERVNADRVANGLQPIAWDDTAALAGQRHSEEMAEFGYMSHWNMDGYGPEYRYSRAGGLDFAQENVYRLVHQWEDGRGAPIDDWDKVIADAQAALMNSPGHRKNILTPEHTHLGVGIAYNPQTGNVAIAQEFVNRFVTIEPLPRRAQPGDRVVLRGALLEGSTNPLVNLAYEPFPAPMTLEQLNKTGTYTPAAKHQSVPHVRVDADGRFVSEFALPKDAAPGLYHVLMWAESPGATEKVLAVDAIIEVNQ